MGCSTPRPESRRVSETPPHRTTFNAETAELAEQNGENLCCRRLRHPGGGVTPEAYGIPDLLRDAGGLGGLCLAQAGRATASNSNPTNRLRPLRSERACLVRLLLPEWAYGRRSERRRTGASVCVS